MINLLIALFIISQPSSDVAFLRSVKVEYAVLYNADFSQRTETTNHSTRWVSIRQYDKLVRGSGHAIHVHLNNGCATFSYEDIENAMLTNVADTSVVASDGHTYFAIRKVGGWKYLGLRQFEREYFKQRQLYSPCRALHETWIKLSDKFGFMYLSLRR